MINTEKINFRQSRDFGETFNVSVTFIRRNSKLFLQSLIFIAGPFILLSSIAGAYYQASAINMMSIAKLAQTGNILGQFGWAYLVFILAAVLANLMLVGTVYSFMITYMEKGPGNFTVSDVGKMVLKNAGNILSVFFILTLLMILVVGVFVGIMIGLTSAVPVLGIFFALAIVVAMLILFPPLMWQLSVVYLVKMQDDDKSVMQSFGHTGKVMKDNFWWTWVIIVCAAIALMIISIVFTMPQIIYQAVLMFSHLRGGEATSASVPFLIVSTVCTFCTTFLYSGLYVICGFHYYSLAEQKDGVGLMERINEIGNTPSDNVDQQY